ncbi:MAG: hypothetical protein K6U74_14475 [Firmicutes bacterium]|nr:hypothetical protein [Bacillota bacterium]
MNKGRPLAACFDFSGVIVDHRNKRPIPGMEELIKDLYARGWLLAVVSRFDEKTVAEHLGQGLRGCFKRVYSARDRGKLDYVQEFARECGVSDLSRMIFIDDKPKNLREVAASPVSVIGFLGSGKYDTGAACKEIGVPFARTVAELRDLLG